MQESVENAVLALSRDPSRAAEASAYLLAFQNGTTAWEVAEALLGSQHEEVVLFAACCLHNKAKVGGPAQSAAELCERLCVAVAVMQRAAVRSQLCLAVALLAAGFQGGPAALCRSGVFASLPASSQVEVLAALPQALSPPMPLLQTAPSSSLATSAVIDRHPHLHAGLPAAP